MLIHTFVFRYFLRLRVAEVGGLLFTARNYFRCYTYFIYNFLTYKVHFLSCISYQKQAFFSSSSSKTIKALKLCFHQDITQPMIKFWRIPKYLANTIHQYAQLLPPCLHPVSSQTLQTLLRQAMCNVQGVSKKELSEIKKLSGKD